jgi:uncharacterized membrane protein YidH (DUF202 family)
VSGVLDKVEMSLHQHIAAWHVPRQIARFALTVILALPGVLAAGQGRLHWADLWAALPAALSVAVEQMWKTVPLDKVLATLAAERRTAADPPEPREPDEIP